MIRKQLKVLQVVPYFYPAWAYGGIPKVVYELSKELVKSGHDVTVYTTDALDQDSRYDLSVKETVIDGVKVRYFKNLSNMLAYNYQIFIPLGLCKAIKKNISYFDIIHLHGHRHFLNNVVHYYAKKAKKPYIFSGHGTVPRIERRLWAKAIFDKIFGRQILRDAAHFVAVSNNEIKQYHDMGIVEEKITVINNGIDINTFEVLPKKNKFKKEYNLMNKKIILYLGKITPRKGGVFLVKAFSKLKRDDIVLVFAGNDMGFKKKIIKAIKESSVAQRVIFTGLLTGDKKLSAYVDADILVYPAIYEIFGLVPFEAIMCGVPVIVTDDCGCGEIIGKEDIGYLVKYNDIYGLRDLINKILSDTNTAYEKVKKGREFITNNLNWRLISNKYIDVYNRII